VNAEGMIAAGVMTAATVRQAKPGMDDEQRKRWLLSSLGWKFDRQRNRWFDPDDREEWFSPDHELEAVCAFMCAKLDAPRMILCGELRLGEENGDPQPGEKYQFGGVMFVVTETTLTKVRVRRDEEA
jgi:hypothetical protein